MLTGPEIRRLIKDGSIVIDPFNISMVNPNSVNVRLGRDLLVYSHHSYDDNGFNCYVDHLDPYKDNPTSKITIPESGLVLVPNQLYLGVTIEYTESWVAIPMINGRSSLARLGLLVHQTGGFGDLGFCGRWTLELSCVQQIKVYPGMPIAQICWFKPVGSHLFYDGKYAKSDGEEPVASRFHYEKKR